MKKTSFFSSYGRRLLLCFTILAAAVFLSACSGSGERVSDIKSVTYSAENAEISVEATLDSADVREFRGETVYLIEVPANSDVSHISTLIPIAQQKAAAEMTFSFAPKDSARTRLYSGFVLAVFDRTQGYIPLCDVKYLDNPESLAQNKKKYPEFSSIKGLSLVSLSDGVALGVKHTVIRIPIEEYILPEAGENSLSFIFDGTPYYFSSQKIGELDYKIKNLTGAGIEIFLEFTLNQSREALPSAMSELVSKSTVLSNEAAADANSFSISVSSGNGYRYMAALFELFAERYTRADEKYGFAASYIIGNGVNSEEDDPKTLSERTAEYSKLLRIASTALRSKYAEGRIFVSLDHLWKFSEGEAGAGAENQGGDIPNIPTPLKTTFCASEFLKALDNATGGDLEYGVALMPTEAENVRDDTTDTVAGQSERAHFLTFENLSDARALMGEDRELILYNYQLSSEDERDMASSYAYAYLKAVEAGASAFIYNGQWDMTTGNGKSGLWSLGEDGGASEKRAVYQVFASIDSLDATLPAFVEERLGNKWTALYEKYGKKIKSASYSSGKASTIKDEDDKALKKAEEILVFDFSSGQSFDFFPSDSSQYVEIGRLGNSTALKSGLLPKYRGENVGVRSSEIPYDTLKRALQIKVVLSADSGEGNTASVTLALSQESEKGSVFHTSSAQIQASNPQTVYFDVRDAELDPDLGDVTLYVWVKNEGSRSLFYSDGIADREQLLYIESISALCKKQGLGAFAVILIIIILVAVAGFVFFTFFGKGGKGGRGSSQTFGGGRGPSSPKNRPPHGRSNVRSNGRSNAQIGQKRPQGNLRNHPYPQRPAGYVPQRGLGAGADNRSRWDSRAQTASAVPQRKGAEMNVQGRTPRPKRPGEPRPKAPNNVPPKRTPSRR